MWLQAELDDRKKVRQEFSTRELFPKEDQRLGRLRGQYDTKSVLTHISTHSLAQNVKAVREKGGLQLYLSSSGLAFSGVPGMLTYFMNVIDSQCAILDLFGEIFLSAKTGAGDGWLAQSTQIFERVGRHVRKAEPTISAWVRSLREQTDS